MNVLQSALGTVLGILHRNLIPQNFVEMAWTVTSFGPEMQFGMQTFPPGCLSILERNASWQRRSHRAFEHPIRLKATAWAVLVD